jgi:heme-degrading monooxygenase HmoA
METTQSKFTMIYSFRVLEGKEQDFINSWAALTNLFYEFAGSYGSRLHKADDQLFIAYAQWPDKETFDVAGDKLPEESNLYRQQLRASCSEIKTEFELGTIVKDLLKNGQHPAHQ